MPTEVADAAAAAVAIAVAIAVHRFRKATRSAHLGDPPLNVTWLLAVLPILLLYLRPDESSAKSYGIVVVSIVLLLAHATLVLPYRSVMVMLWVLGSLEDRYAEREMDWYDGGIITVMILSFVAEGICRTGALDYYMGLVLGNPKTVSGAQIRLMIPVAILSAFLYNSPIVVAMIPITIRWAIKIGVPHQQLLLPLSCAAFLGGACTLVGTSTNLILSNLLEKRYPNEASANIGLFGLAVYGVPNMMIGLAYILVCSPFLLRMGKGRNKNSHNMVGSGDGILLGALVECWSPVAGRTYKQSGLGNSNDVFLISVRRATTGYIHTAISEDFVFSVGDELYFSGLVEMYGYFGVKYGLSLIAAQYPTDGDAALPPMLWPQSQSTDEVARVGVKEMELVRRIHLMYDQIGGQVPVDLQSSRPAEIIVTPDETGQAILVGVDCQNRPRLIAKIEDILSTQVGLIIFYSDVKVFGKRSVSVWGCKLGGKSNASPNQDFERIADAVERISDAISSLLRSSDQALPLHPRYTYRTTPEMRRRGLEELRFMHFFWEQFDLYTTSCYAFGVGTALQKSGVAKGVATLLVNVGMSLGVGDAGVYCAVYFASNLLSGLAGSTTAIATLMFPIAMETADKTGLDRVKLCYILMLSSSDYIVSSGNASLHHWAVYRNIDFLKFGAPLQILLGCSSSAMVATLSVEDSKWIITWVAVFIVSLGCFIASTRTTKNAKLELQVLPRPSLECPVGSTNGTIQPE